MTSPSVVYTPNSYFNVNGNSKPKDVYSSNYPKSEFSSDRHIYSKGDSDGHIEAIQTAVPVHNAVAGRTVMKQNVSSRGDSTRIDWEQNHDNPNFSRHHESSKSESALPTESRDRAKELKGVDHEPTNTKAVEEFRRSWR